MCIYICIYMLYTLLYSQVKCWETESLKEMPPLWVKGEISTLYLK